MSIKQEVTDRALEILRDQLMSLFGRAFARGNHKKFERTIGKFLASQAERTGFSACSEWFGEYICTRPDGRYFVRFSKQELSHLPDAFARLAFAIQQMESAGEQFWSWTFDCDPGNFEDDSRIAQCATFIPHNLPNAGPGPPPPPGPGPSPGIPNGLTGIGILAGVILVGVLIFRRG